jgi:LEA14-like dessication related protein
MPRNFKMSLALICTFGLAIISGCAVLGDVIHQPGIRVNAIESQWITPEHWRLLAQLKVKNSNPLTLSFSRASYSVFLNGHRVQTKVFTALPVVPPYSIESFTIPLLLNISDISKYASKDSKIQLKFKGQLFPTEKANLSSLEFEYESQLDIPQLPALVCKQIKPIKKKKGQVFLFETHNPNTYPITLIQIKGYVEINNMKYKLEPMLNKIIITPKTDKKLFVISRTLTNTVIKKHHKLRLICEVELQSKQGTMIVPLVHEMKY